MGSQPWSTVDARNPLSLSPIFLRATMVDGWRWVAANTNRATIAYTGNNVPYPLVGEHLTNRVYYVNIDRHRDWRFHDYDRAYRAGTFTPMPPLLATSSGELMPVDAPTCPPR